MSLVHVDNSQQVPTAKHFDSFDFSTLYTSIPHVSLKQALRSLIQEAYKVRDNIFLIADFRGTAYWSDTPSKVCSRYSLTEEKLMELVEYLIDNVFVSVGNRVYKQCVGIPMGTDCAPLLANLFLFYYEYRYMKSLISSNISLAKRYTHTMRYIDDLLALNNSGFAGRATDIYPSELVLKKTTEGPTELSYLDLLITIDGGKYSTAIYDKRDSFNFNIVNFPHNISSKPAYGVYISQLVRIGRICSSFPQFKDRHYRLTRKLMEQGFWYSGLCAAFKKFTRLHKDIVSKYKCSVRKHLAEGICLPLCVAALNKHITTRRR